MKTNKLTSNLYCLIMAGGKGTRFWPESTSKRPKQYLKFVGDNSLLEDTLKRFDGLVSESERFIVTVKEQEELVKENSKEMIGDRGIIFEPSGRNTAPCILLSLTHLLSYGASEDDLVAIVPADHVILNQKGFKETLSDAAVAARKEEKIVTIGITPTFPHTGYGYIKKGQEEDDFFEVDSFKEKPDFDTAKTYLESGNYLWNAGMFVSSIKTLMNEIEAHAPEIYCYFKKLKEDISDFKKVSEIYESIPRDSIDCAVMEKSQKVLVVPARFDWNDLGAWDALEAVIEKKSQNILIGERDYFIERAEGNIVYAPDKFVSLVGVKDLIVVANEKALMVLPKTESQNVKKIVEYISKESAKDLKDLL